MQDFVRRVYLNFVDK